MFGLGASRIEHAWHFRQRSIVYHMRWFRRASPLRHCIAMFTVTWNILEVHVSRCMGGTAHLQPAGSLEHAAAT
jgi:hypothetical protein